MIQWLKSWLLATWRAWNIYHAHVDPNFPCPACGARLGKIRWVSRLKFPDGKQGAIVHTCGVCSASWGEKPIVQAKDWDIQLDADNGGVEAPFIHRQPAVPVRSFKAS